MMAFRPALVNFKKFKLDAPNRKSPVRIPLDYYQILGILPEAPEEQISLAYQDKMVQMPHFGFSEGALESRRTLLREARTILTTPNQRREYDQRWWGKSGDALLAEVALAGAEPETQTEQDKEPFLDIEESQLIGSLLILQDLGNYALSLELAETALQRDAENTDYLLIFALSYLELSRDQWHNQDYEEAAASVLKALARLQTAGQFPALQDEIREELYKLRPYRIFELITLPLTEVGARQRGVDLLRALIQDRGGIEGRGNDQSGLNGEDFVKFIQQLRGHLSLEEQAELFLPEASRPSALAAYLGFHTQTARAVAQKQPAQLQVAQQLLDTLANRQDVTLEKAICALLLGQTESALDWVSQTQDVEALSAIRNLSQNEPDLLPGLYVYTESWLQEEISPYFRELPPSLLRLDDYFNDLDVQNYLETYSLTPPLSSSSEPSALPAMAIPLPAYSDDLPEKRPPSRRRSARLRAQSLAPATAASISPPDSAWRERPGRPLHTALADGDSIRWPETPVSPAAASSALVPAAPSRRKRRKKSGKVTLNPLRFGLFILALASLVGLGSLALIYGRDSGLGLAPDPLEIELAAPPVAIPGALEQTQILLSDPQLSPATAQNIVDTWLQQKAAAFGPQRDVAALDQILSANELSKWQRRARENQDIRRYDHQVQILSQTIQPNNPTQGEIVAQVKETTRYASEAQPEKTLRQDVQDLTVRYEVNYQNDQWKITGISAR